MTTWLPFYCLLRAIMPRNYFQLNILTPREKLMLLANLLPAAAEANPDLLDMREENIDGISILGKSKGISKATAGNLVQRYLENKVFIA